MKEFKTKKINVVKEMIKILDQPCLCRMATDEMNQLEYVFPYSDEVFSAYVIAKNRVYKKD